MSAGKDKKNSYGALTPAAKRYDDARREETKEKSLLLRCDVKNSAGWQITVQRNEKWTEGISFQKEKQ